THAAQDTGNLRVHLRSPSKLTEGDIRFPLDRFVLGGIEWQVVDHHSQPPHAAGQRDQIAEKRVVADNVEFEVEIGQALDAGDEVRAREAGCDRPSGKANAAEQAILRESRQALAEGIAGLEMSDKALDDRIVLGQIED